MAYVSKEKASEVRKQLKAAFGKEFKFSVTKEHSSTLNVSLMASPFKIEWRSEHATKFEYQTINYRNVNREELLTEEQKAFFQKVTDIAMDGNFDKSDTMTDYFHVGYYFDLSVGKWDKPYIQTTK